MHIPRSSSSSSSTSSNVDVVNTPPPQSAKRARRVDTAASSAQGSISERPPFGIGTPAARTAAEVFDEGGDRAIAARQQRLESSVPVAAAQAAPQRSTKNIKDLDFNAAFIKEVQAGRITMNPDAQIGKPALTWRDPIENGLPQLNRDRRHTAALRLGFEHEGGRAYVVRRRDTGKIPFLDVYLGTRREGADRYNTVSMRPVHVPVTGTRDFETWWAQKFAARLHAFQPEDQPQGGPAVTPVPVARTKHRPSIQKAGTSSEAARRMQAPEAAEPPTVIVQPQAARTSEGQSAGSTPAAPGSHTSVIQRAPPSSDSQPAQHARRAAGLPGLPAGVQDELDRRMRTHENPMRIFEWLAGEGHNVDLDDFHDHYVQIQEGMRPRQPRR